MDEQELTLLEQFAPNHPELQEMWDKHTVLKKQLDKMQSKAFHTPEDEANMKAVKKEKLEVKTKLLEFVSKLAE